jgi:hypothetical protein
LRIVFRFFLCHWDRIWFIANEVNGEFAADFPTSKCEWLIALNGQPEIESGMEPVGSGLNGRRRNGA